jgi:hypothetical protein
MLDGLDVIVIMPGQHAQLVTIEGATNPFRHSGDGIADRRGDRYTEWYPIHAVYGEDGYKTEFHMIQVLEMPGESDMFNRFVDPYGPIRGPIIIARSVVDDDGGAFASFDNDIQTLNWVFHYDQLFQKELPNA